MIKKKQKQEIFLSCHLLFTPLGFCARVTLCIGESLSHIWMIMCVETTSSMCYWSHDAAAASVCALTAPLPAESSLHSGRSGWHRLYHTASAGDWNYYIISCKCSNSSLSFWLYEGDGPMQMFLLSGSLVNSGIRRISARGCVYDWNYALY